MIHATQGVNFCTRITITVTQSTVVCCSDLKIAYENMPSKYMMTQNHIFITKWFCMTMVGVKPDWVINKFITCWTLPFYLYDAFGVCLQHTSPGI